MSINTNIVDYYRARASEYEQVYAKPERQSDLARLHREIPAQFQGRRVLEVACGTGYWTRRIALRATAITAVDLAPEPLELARLQQPIGDAVTFLLADAFALEQVSGEFDGGFAGFWWSHVSRADLPRFLRGFHNRLTMGSRVVVVDNRYVADSNSPIIRRDEDGNMFQLRRLSSGSEHEVLKNFPTATEVIHAASAAGGGSAQVHELTYYWWASYEVAFRP